MTQGLIEMTFSEKLSELVEAHADSIPKISERAGIKLSTFNDYLYKGKIPSAMNLFRISKALGVSCEVFSECEDGANKEEPKPAKKKK